MLDNNELLSRFVGEKYSQFYREKWFKGAHASLDSKMTSAAFSVNWAGVFLGVFWLCYRKMYVFAFTLAIIIPFFDIFSMHSKGVDGYSGFDSLIYSLVWMLTTGLLGNTFYRYHSVKKINKIVEGTSDTDRLAERLYKQGGTTWVGAIVFGTFAVLTIALMYVLFAPSWY